MNKDRRKKLTRALEMLDQMEGLFSEVLAITEEVRSDEEDALSNLPESLQEGERGPAMQEVIDALEGVTMEDAFSEVRDAIERAAA